MTIEIIDVHKVLKEQTVAQMEGLLSLLSPKTRQAVRGVFPAPLVPYIPHGIAGVRIPAQVHSESEYLHARVFLNENVNYTAYRCVALMDNQNTEVSVVTCTDRPHIVAFTYAMVNTLQEAIDLFAVK